MKWLNDYTIIMAGIVLVIAMAFVLTWMRPVSAAPPAVSDNCVEVARVGDNATYFCESDFGPDFLQNSVGFIQVVEN